MAVHGLHLAENWKIVRGRTDSIGWPEDRVWAGEGWVQRGV